MTITADKIRFPDEALTTLKQIMCNINPVADKSTYTNKQQSEMILDLATLDAFVNVAEDGATPIWKSMTDTGGSSDLNMDDVNGAIATHAADSDAHHVKYTDANAAAQVTWGNLADNETYKKFLATERTTIGNLSTTYLALAGGTVTGSLNVNGGLLAKGVNYLQSSGGTTWLKTDANGIGFPNGIAFDSDIGAATEAIAASGGIMNFSAANGFKFNGDTRVITNSGTNAFYINRVPNRLTTETFKIWVEDTKVVHHYNNDEAVGQIEWTVENTDTESGGGVDANTTTMKLFGESVNPRLDVGGGRVSNVKLPSVASDAATKGYVDGRTAGYLPLTGGTVTGTTSFTGELTVLGGGNTLIGTAGGFPFFPLGIVLGSSSSAVESIWSSDGIVYITASNSVNMSTPIDMAGNKITGLVNPTQASDAATKAYVDDNYLRRIGGISYPMAGYLFTGGYGIAFESTTPMNTWVTTGVESTKTYLQLMGKDEVLISSGGASGKLRAKIDSNGVRVLNSDNTHSALISVNATGNLVLTVESGKGILFAEG